MTFLSDTFKGVKDSTICEWYYYLFLFNAGLFSLLIISLIVLLFVNSKVFMKMVGGNFILPIVTTLIGLTSGLFFYLMCDRTLLKH